MTGCDDEASGAGQPVSCRTATIVVTLAVAAGFFSLAPFLRLFEFSNGGENAVVASVQEMRRGGPWLVPTLHEEMRTKKPPLATWLSALATRPETAAGFSSPDSAVRAAAFERFGWEVRWPSLIAMTGVIAATYILGKMLGGIRLGVFSAVVCASSFFWLKNARLTTTDAHLALWVSVANCFLAWAVLNRKWWPGFIGAGIALGLGMMSKGPVALVQSVVPVIAYIAWRWWRVPRDAGVSRKPFLWPLVVGVALFAAVGLSWYVLVLWNRPDVLAEWKMEVTREGATDLDPSPWYNYSLIVAHMFPWSMFLVAGLIGSATLVVKRQAAAGIGHQIVLALLLLVVPILIMSLFRDRKLRYIIPLLTPASIVAAWGMLELLGPGAVRRRTTPWLVGAFHWLPLLLAALALPLGGAFRWLGMERFDGGPWYSLRYALIAAQAFLLVIVAGMLLQRRKGAWGVLGSTAIVMIAWNVVLNTGYRNSREGRSEMRPLAEQILRDAPNAGLYSYRADRPIRRAPIDLSIYLNRVVENVKDPAEAMTAAPSPKLFIVRRRDGEPPPAPPTAGGEWNSFAETRVDNSTWHTFISTTP